MTPIVPVPHAAQSPCPSPRRVAVVFANLKGNLGDYAILAAMLEHIQGRFARPRIDIYSHRFTRVDELRTAEFLRRYPATEVSVAGTTEYIAIPGWCKRLRRVGLWKPVQACYVSHLAAKARRDAGRFSAYDEILLAGGDQWNGRELGVSMFATLLALRQVNTSISSFPVSLSPQLGTFNYRHRLRKYFSALGSPLPVRDSISAATAARIGIPHVSVPDSVFSLAQHAVTIQPARSADASRILISLTATARGFEKDLERVVQELRERFGAVGLLTTCEPEDGAMYRRVCARSGAQFVAPSTWEEATAEIKASRVLITNRFHGLVFASMAETPVLVVTDRNKAEAFALDAGVESRVDRVSSVDRDAVEQALHHAAETVASTRRYRDAALQAFHDGMSAMARIGA